MAILYTSKAGPGETQVTGFLSEGIVGQGQPNLQEENVRCSLIGEGQSETRSAGNPKTKNTGVKEHSYLFLWIISLPDFWSRPKDKQQGSAYIIVQFLEEEPDKIPAEEDYSSTAFPQHGYSDNCNVGDVNGYKLQSRHQLIERQISERETAQIWRRSAVEVAIRELSFSVRDVFPLTLFSDSLLRQPVFRVESKYEVSERLQLSFTLRANLLILPQVPVTRPSYDLSRHHRDGLAATSQLATLMRPAFTKPCIPLRSSLMAQALPDASTLQATHWLAKYLQVLKAETKYTSQSLSTAGSFPWIFNHDAFTRWINCGDSDIPLWILGKPGSGKSTLIKQMVQVLQQLPVFEIEFSVRSTYLPLQSGTWNQQSVLTSFLQNSLRQLLEQELRPPCNNHILQEFLDEIDHELPGNWSRQPEILASHLNSLVTNLSSASVVFLCVDGLDELEASDAAEILNFLIPTSYKKWNSNVRICIGSRDTKFKQDGHLYLLVHEENQEDIADYLNAKLEHLCLEDMPSEISDEVIGRLLAQKANGVFLWAHLVVRNLEMTRTYRFNNMVLLRNLPSDLESLYRYLLESLGPTVIRIMSCLLLAMRPLTILELYDLIPNAYLFNMRRSSFPLDSSDALVKEQSAWKFVEEFKSRSRGFIEFYTLDAVDHQSPMLITSSAQSLVYFKHLSMVQFLHSTVHEFLAPLLPSNFPVVNVATAKACLHLQIADHLYDVTKLSVRLAGVIATSGMRIQAAIPLLDYACTFMAKHAKAADRSFLSKADIRVLFPGAAQSTLPEWKSIKHYFPQGTPEWMFSESSMLFFDAYYGLHDLIEMHLELGSQGVPGLTANEKNAFGRSLLHIAAMAGQVEVVRILLQAGAECRQLDPVNGHSPLKDAVWAGQTPVVEELLLHHAEVDEHVSGTSALSLASAVGSLGSVRLLLRYGANPNLRDTQRGQAPLSLAISNAHVGICKLLVSKGADVNDQDLYTGLTPLHHAVMARSPDILRLLLLHGAIVRPELASVLEDTQAAWVKRILAFYVRGNENCWRKCPDGSKGNPSTSSAITGSALNRRQESSVTRNKRGRPDGGDDEDDQGNSRKRRKAEDGTCPPGESNDDSLYACPYAEYDRRRWGTDDRCVRNGWTIPRLRQHLERVHRLSKCEHCGEAGMVNDTLLNDHIRFCQRPQLPLRNYSDGYYRSQADEMRKRWRDVDPREKWLRIYRILFPNASEPATVPVFEGITERLRRAEAWKNVARDVIDHETFAAIEDRVSRNDTQAQRIASGTPILQTGDQRLLLPQHSTPTGQSSFTGQPVSATETDAPTAFAFTGSQQAFATADADAPIYADHNAPAARGATQANAPNSYQAIALPGDPDSTRSQTVTRNADYYARSNVHPPQHDSGYGSTSAHTTDNSYRDNVYSNSGDGTRPHAAGSDNNSFSTDQLFFTSGPSNSNAAESDPFTVNWSDF